MNILLTSAGRRTYMVDYFRKALDGRGLLFAANSQMSPALLNSDGYFITPLIYSDDYIPFLMNICRENSIGMIVSLFDIDIPVLSAHRADFESIGVKLAMSDSTMLESCSDKLKMGKRLAEAGIETPKTFTDTDAVMAAVRNGEIDFPVLIKPRFGMGSIGVLKAYDEAELKAAYSMCLREVKGSYLRFESAAAPEEPVIIQEFRKGSEFGLDIISDLDGRYVNTIIRRKYAMRSGETDEAIILGSSDKGYAQLLNAAEALAAEMGPKGLIDVDMIMDEEELIPRVIDINARFGGGYPFSHAAGADVPKAYVLWAEGLREEADRYCTAESGVHGYKDIVPKIYGTDGRKGQ